MSALQPRHAQPLSSLEGQDAQRALARRQDAAKYNHPWDGYTS